MSLIYTKCLALVRESKSHSKRRKDETLERFSGREVVRVFGNRSHVRLVEMDQFPVILDTRGSHGFGEDGGATGDCIKLDELIHLLILKGQKTYHASSKEQSPE